MIKIIFDSEWFGYVATFLLLGSYFLISVGVLSSEGPYYFILTFFGSLMLALHSYVRGVNAVVLLNFLLCLVSIIGIFRVLN